ncbi:MAG: hypothetical protein F4213_13315 [Boseongicola sp. SB0677_bin_26]|nr:hypothetical protein [Boseongicola sp. SB0677_bin_26]
MTAPEFRWPGKLELPFLLVFVFGVVVVAFLLAEAVEDDALHGRPDREAEAGGEARGNSAGRGSESR